MNYRDTFNKFESLKAYNLHKHSSAEKELKPEQTYSPRNSEKAESRLYQTIESLRERPSIVSQKSHDAIPRSFQTTRNHSSFKVKPNDQSLRVEELMNENSNLREKLDILQKERDIIKQWKKPQNKAESKVYQEKLSFLVKNIQQFLGSSLKFQSMLREKLGQSVASVYEEERNQLKKQMISAAQEFEIPMKYSPISSPLRLTRSPREECSSYDSETTKILEELKQEKNKTKRLQNELSMELNKKDSEMQNIRDRLLELESIEKNKIENEKKFFKASQDWQAERKELCKEIDKSKFESIKIKEKFGEFDKIYSEMQKENYEIKGKYEEILSENLKLSESLQTYDRLYNYTKKWAEKAVEEARNEIYSEIAEVNEKVNLKFKELLEINEKIKQIGRKEKPNESINQKFKDSQAKIAEITKENIAFKARCEALDAKNRELGEENEELLESIEKLKANSERLRGNLEDAWKVHEELAQMKLAKLSEDKAIVEHNKVLEEVEMLREVIERNKEEMESLQKSNKKLGHQHSEKLKELEKEISKINNELTHKDAQIVHLQSSNDALQCSSTKQQQTIKDLTIKNQQALEDFNKLVEKLSKSAKDSEQQSAALLKLTKENQLLKEDSEISALNQTSMINTQEELKLYVLEKEESLKSCYDDIKNLKQIISTSKEATEVLEAKLEGESQTILLKDQQIKNLKQELERLKKLLKESEAQNNGLQELTTISEKSKFLSERILQIEDESRVIQLQNLELVEKINLFESKQAELQQLLKIREKSIETLELSLSDHNSILTTLSSKEKYTQKLESQISALTLDLNQRQSIISSLQKEISSSSTTIESYEFKLKSLEEIPVLQKEISKLQDSLSSTIRNTNTLEKLLKEKDEQLKLKDLQIRETESLRERNASLTDAIAKLKLEITEYQDRLKKAEGVIKDFEKEVEELKDLGIVNFELTEKIELKDKEIEELNLIHVYEVDSLTSKIKDVEEEGKKAILRVIEGKDLEISRINEQIKHIESKLSENDPEEFKDLKLNFNHLSLENEKLNLLIESLTKSNKSLSKSESELQTAVSLLNSERETLKSECARLHLELSEETSMISALTSDFSNSKAEIARLQEKMQLLSCEFEEAGIADKEEISRLNSEKLKQHQSLDSYKKELSLLKQKLVDAERASRASFHCENCELQKLKLSELECLIHSAEEALGGFFNNSLAESISSLVASKTQNLRRAPRPPLLTSKSEYTKRGSEELKLEIAEKLINKSPMATEGSKRSHSSALSLPDISDLQNELIEEKSESERYLTQIQLLKEHIRELEKKIKRFEDVNGNINAEYLKSTFIQMIKNLPMQNNQIEGMIGLIFNIINVSKEEIGALEPERKSKSKRFGIFNS